MSDVVEFGAETEKFPSAKLSAEGDTVTGVITNVATVQQRKYDPTAENNQGGLLFWTDAGKMVEGVDTGRPVNQTILTLDTGDEKVNVFVKGSLHTAFKNYAKENGPFKLEEGAKVHVERGAQDKKSLKVAYTVAVKAPEKASVSFGETDDTPKPAKKIPF